MNRLEVWRVRTGVAIVLMVLGACAMTWAGFVLARGVPGECGGDAPACPPGSTTAFFALFATIFLLMPVAVALAGRRRPELWPMTFALGFGGLAVGIFSARFVADPITDSTATTWWFVGVTGTLAVLATLAAVTVALVGATEDPHR